MTREEAINELNLMEMFVRTSKSTEAVKIATTALRQQDVTDKDVGHNDPLTLDELLEMEGESVWLVGVRDKDEWVRIDSFNSLTIGFSRFGDEETYCFRRTSYGIRVLAYRQKPEEDDYEH